MCPDNLRATKERQVSVDLVEGHYHDIVIEYRDEGGSSSVQVRCFVTSFIRSFRSTRVTVAVAPYFLRRSSLKELFLYRPKNEFVAKLSLSRRTIPRLRYTTNHVVSHERDGIPTTTGSC